MEQTIKQKKQRKNRKLPQTVYQRLEVICPKLEVEMPDVKQRQILGINIVSTFFDKPNGPKVKKAYKVDSIEDGNSIKVMSYPSYFVPVMDGIIIDFLTPKS